MAEAEEWWTGLVAQVVSVSDLDHTPGAGFMAFGSFVFDPATTAARSTMVVPSTVLGRRNGRAWLTQIGTSFVHDDALPPVTAPVAPRTISYADGGLTGPQWEAAVAEAVRRITAGELEKVVLARDLLARASEPIDPRWIVARLAERYERCWTYLVDGLVGATPEMLLRRENGLVTSRVLAGTIQRSGDNTRDLASAAALARSSKDLEEHEYAVASVADALAPYCSGMNVPGCAVRAGAAERPPPGHRRDRRGRTRTHLAGAGRRPASRARRSAGRRPSRPGRRSPSWSTWTASGTPDRSAGSTPRATGSGGSRCAAASSTRPTPGRSACSPAVAWWPVPTPRPS